MGALKVERKKDTPDQLAVEFIIEGNELHVRKVISLLETLPYPSILSNLTLSVDTEVETKSTVKILVTLVNYDQ